MNQDSIGYQLFAMIWFYLTFAPWFFLLVGILLWGFLARRRREKGFHALKRPRPKPAARFAEAALLLGIGGASFLFMATKADMSGLLLILDKLRPQFAAVNVVVAVCAALGLGISFAIILSGFSRAGVYSGLVVILAYAVILRGPGLMLAGAWLGELAPPGAADTSMHYTFELNPELRGADVFCNGVHLGKSPVSFTWDELQAKVPDWPEPPEGFIEWPSVASPQERTWLKHELEGPAEHWGEHRQSGRSEKKACYFRVRLGDEWGYGWAAGGGGGGGRYLKAYAYTLSVSLPENDARINRLLDQARLSGYEVDAAWLDALESHNMRGWGLLAESMDKDPSMRAVADAWAERRYGIRPQMRPGEAWEALQQIRRQTDGLGWKQRHPVSGYAIRRLAPFLDPDRLADEIVSIFRRYHASEFGWYSHSQGTRFYFSSSWANTRPPPIPGGVNVMLDAMWIVYERLRKENPDRPNPFQEKVAPAMICWRDMIDWALAMGGPHIERYASRQDWRKEVTRGSPDALRFAMVPINRWLYRLANLDTPEGRSFRQRHTREIFQMAEKILEHSLHDLDRKAPFLFLDNELGEDSIAFKFWPQYRQIIAKEPHPRQKELFKYLVRMEPATPIKLYIQCWRLSDVNVFMTNALEPLRDLPVSRRIEIYRALVRDMEQNYPLFAERPDSSIDEETFNRRILDKLRERIRGYEESLKRESEPPAESREPQDGNLWRILEGEARLADLQEPVIKEVLRTARRFLEGNPADDLAKTLAESREPQLRLLVVECAEEHPTSRNRALLDQLLDDSDEEVRAAAQEVKRQLDELAATPPSAFARPPARSDE
jgi:hypothetical protein